MNQSASIEPKKGIMSNKRNSNSTKLLTDESIEDEFEIDLIDEEEQHKTPLIKGVLSVGNNEKTKKGNLSKLTLGLNEKNTSSASKIDVQGKRSKPKLSEQEDDDEEEDEISETTQFKRPPNTPPPITIGKIKIFNPGRRRRAMRARRLMKRCCTLVLTVLFLLVLLYNGNRLPKMFRMAFGWLHKSSYQLGFGRKDLNSRCDLVVRSPVWRQNFPMLTIESALRMIDMNNDSVADVVVAFGTGIDAAFYDSTFCQIYFNQTEAESKTIGCGGGAMVLDGSTGEPIWAQYTAHELFATNCNIDLNLDGQNDCIIAGRMASLFAFDGKRGTVLWSITSNYGEPVVETSNFYTPLFIPRDIDGDSVPDIIVMHGGDPLRKPGERIRNVARLMVISAKTGQILSWSYVPDSAESYYSPQLLVHPDGTQLVLFGTGGETHPGGLYVVGLDSLLSGHLEHNSRPIFLDCCKGVIAPPVLVDINNDHIVDIVLANFNSTVFAFDGLTFEPLWKREFLGAETYSSPTVGFFNEDNVPDFGVTYQFGPGFPIYYYAEFNVIDGRNGELLLKNPIRMPIGTQSSPLTVSTFAQNDIFLFWYSSCSDTKSGVLGNQSSELTDTGPFQISPGSTVHESSRADFCRLRFGDKVQHYTQYRAITMKSSVPIYDSRTDEPNAIQLNFTQIAYQWYESKISSITDRTTSFGQSDTDNNDARLDDGINNQQLSWGPVEQNNLNLNTMDRIKNDPMAYSPETYEQLRKLKKWSLPQNDNYNGNEENDFKFENLVRSRRQSSFPINDLLQRSKRHVGLHNGDKVQRVISTGTLAPSLETSNLEEQLQVDGSIDVVFATYSFPPSVNVKLMSDAVRNCIQTYMTPEKETELRLNDDSQFKRLGYDHDAYEAMVKELCAKEQNSDKSVPEQSDSTSVDNDPVKRNEWIRPMGSMTVHRVNLKCFDQDQHKQVAIKEYRYQWWPSYLGLLADAVANLVDE